MRARAISVALLLAAFGAVLAPAADPGRQFGSRDNGRMHLPNKSFISGELRRGHLPEWNPHAGLGIPIVAGAVDAPLHPLNLLFLALPFDWAFKAWMVLAVLLGGIGAGVLARGLGASEAGCAVAVLAFGLSGFVLSWTDNAQYVTSAGAAPWLLAAVRSHASRGGAWRLLPVLGTSFLLASSGDPITWGVAFALVPAAAVLSDGAPRVQRLRRAGLALAVALAGAAPALLPFALAIPSSSRGDVLAEWERVRWNLHPARLAEVALPYLARTRPGAMSAPAFRAFFTEGDLEPWSVSIYAGAAALALVLLAAFRRRDARWLLALALAAAWAAAGHRLGFGLLAAKLPVLGSIRYWERLGWLIALSLALGAALGTTELLARPPSPGLGTVAVLLLASAACVRMIDAPLVARLAATVDEAAAAELVRNVAAGLLHGGLALAALSVLPAAGRAAGRFAWAAPVLVVAVVAADLAIANARAVVLVDASAVHPPQPLAGALQGARGPVRIATPVAAGAWPRDGETEFEAAVRVNARMMEGASGLWSGIGNVAPYSGLVPRRLLQMFRLIGSEGMARIAGRWGVSYLVVPGDPLAAARRLQLDLPPTVIATDDVVPASLIVRPARPRAYLADHVVRANADRALAFAIGLEPPDLDSVVEGPVPEDLAPPAGSASVVRDEPDRVEVAVATDREALLVLNDMDADGWTAAIDGTPARILTANFLVRGVWVPAGRHDVTFTYRTPGLAWGVAVALAATLALAMAGVWTSVRSRRSRACAARS